MYTSKREAKNVKYFVQDSFSSQFQWKSGRFDQGAITENEKEIREDQYLTFAIRDKAINFIQQHKDEPFFLYCPYHQVNFLL